MNKTIMINAGFSKEVELVNSGLCPFCKEPIKMSDFKDGTSLREFDISGLCQKCQDEFFG